MPAKKPRLFYLDFVRAIAVVAIILTHYNVPYIGVPQRAADIVTTTVGGIYIGDWGVSLFFIISGAALMYVYGDRCSLKTFYWKRFKSIFPLFWIAYLLAAFYIFLTQKGLPFAAPRSHFLFTILGVDQLAGAGGIATFSLISEWFLGVILAFYVVFPLIRWLVVRFPKATAAGAIIVYALVLVLPELSLPKSCILLTRLPEIMLGMVFVRYFKKVPLPLALGSLILVFANAFLRVPLPPSLITTIIGAASFFLLAYMAKWVDRQPVRVICSYLCKYSYPIFLIHHFIINQILSGFDLIALTKIENYILFGATATVILAVSMLLYHLDKRVQSFVRRMFQKTM